MSALAEHSIEPSSSTENPFFEQSGERVKEWPSGETTLPANSHRLRLVDIDDERNEFLYPGVCRMVVGKRPHDTIIYVGMDDEPAVGRGGEITAGAVRLSWPVNVVGLAELRPGVNPWSDATIASGYSHWRLSPLIDDKSVSKSEYSIETWQDWSVGIADSVQNRETDTISGLVDAHLLSGFIRKLKRSIPGGITAYEFHVTRPASETTQEVTESVLKRITKLQRTPEEERAPWGTWPDERAFDDARTFALMWPSDTIRIPDIGLADDGEVNFLWEGADVHVDLGFYGDGTFSYYAKDGDGKEYTDDDVPAHVGLPANLLALLKSEA